MTDSETAATAAGLKSMLRGLRAPFNIFATVVLTIGFIVVVLRFTRGLGAVTNLSQEFPWGIWIGFDVLVGVALAAGGFLIASAVHLMGLKEYRIILRPAILTGFLGYFFVVVGLILDLGRPWRLPYPMVVSLGAQSVMFLVAWHVALYLTVQFLEFSSAIFEWRGWNILWRWAVALMPGACIAGVILSMLHQSALGALFLLAPTKVHPLWYSPLMPLFFFSSAIAAGLSMVIFESWMSHRYLSKFADPGHEDQLRRVTFSLSKFASVVLICYFFIKWIGIAHDQRWPYLNTPMGYWFLFEIVGFVLVPAFLYGIGVRNLNLNMVRLAAVLCLIGVVLNRLNVSIIGFQMDSPNRYIPSWMEVAGTLAIITTGIVTYRWIVVRMPVLRRHPAYPDTH